MVQKKTLNERRLTRRQVQELIAKGARLRPDLAATFEQTFSTGYKNQPLVYELDGERFLFVFDPAEPNLGGKGDIYPADYFHRLVRWTAKVSEDYEYGRESSVGHWAYYSVLKHELIAHIETLVHRLREVMSLTPDDLDFSYQSLDLVSAHVESVGVERAQQELYDQMVAYVGEVLRVRIQGRWEVNSDFRAVYPHLPSYLSPYPFLVAEKHGPVMPINVVWQELSGLEPVNLRAEAANEVRRTRKYRLELS